jgi:hypothetical protein
MKLADVSLEFDVSVNPLKLLFSPIAKALFQKINKDESRLIGYKGKPPSDYFNAFHPFCWCLKTHLLRISYPYYR